MAKNWSFMSTKKKAKSTRQKLIAALDALFSKLVRARDKHVCRKCGRSRVFCHHIFSRKYLGTRWFKLNALSLCHGCHLWAHSDPIPFHDWVRSWMGSEYDVLQFKAYAITKYNEAELGLMKEEMKRELEAA